VLEADVEVDRRDFAVRAELAVAPGERLALFGPSGAGKTTLLEAIAGLAAPHRARITLAGRVLTSTAPPVVAVPPWRRRVGLLRQDPGLFPHLSVRDNLRYSGHVDQAELESLAAALGIEGLLGSMPARLSGGQAHRVALGRLLLSRCDVMLLDEPYTGLDAALRRTLSELVIASVRQRGIPAILVAHELAEAQAFADRLAIIDRGALLQTGAPDEVVRRPASRRVAELVGYTAFVAAGGEAGVAGASLRAGPVYGVHPDRVISGSHEDLGVVLRGTVASCRPSGARWEISLRTGEATVTGRVHEPVPADAQLAVTVLHPPCFGPDGVAADQSQLRS
jgi:ABC-type Fe3+/spermidine/putrescine transport system ATPase subunit